MKSERYSRQIALKDFGESGQEKLSQAKVLVIGAGGLGIPVLTYLNAMGVGILGILDHDRVALSNLHRQVLYQEKDLDVEKVTATIEKLQAQNPNTQLIGHKTYLNVDNVLQLLRPYDVIVDASDNFPTRYLINDACIILRKPFVYGALHGYEGQVSVFNYNGGPTYRCFFPNMPNENEVPNCNEHGVLGIIPGIVGNLQALETIKIIAGIGEVLSGSLLLYDGLSQTMRKIRFKANPENLNRNKLELEYAFTCESDVRAMAADDFERILLHGEPCILDVRTKLEYEGGHLKASVNIPLADLKDNFESMPKAGPVYVICQSGVRSKKAITVLRKINPNRVFVPIEGGLNKIMDHARKSGHLNSFASNIA